MATRGGSCINYLVILWVRTFLNYFCELNYVRCSPLCNALSRSLNEFMWKEKKKKESMTLLPQDQGRRQAFHNWEAVGKHTTLLGRHGLSRHYYLESVDYWMGDNGWVETWSLPTGMMVEDSTSHYWRQAPIVGCFDNRRKTVKSPIRAALEAFWWRAESYWCCAYRSV